MLVRMSFASFIIVISAIESASLEPCIGALAYCPRQRRRARLCLQPPPPEASQRNPRSNLCAFVPKPIQCKNVLLDLVEANRKMSTITLSAISSVSEPQTQCGSCDFISSIRFTRLLWST